jgi:hypothetical protein
MLRSKGVLGKHGMRNTHRLVHSTRSTVDERKPFQSSIRLAWGRENSRMKMRDEVGGITREGSSAVVNGALRDNLIRVWRPALLI